VHNHKRSHAVFTAEIIRPVGLSVGLRSYMLVHICFFYFFLFLGLGFVLFVYFLFVVVNLFVPVQLIALKRRVSSMTYYELGFQPALLNQITRLWY